MSLGFLGAGKVAQTIAKGLITAGAISAESVAASAPSDRCLKEIRELGIGFTHSNKELLQMSEIVFLAVKPPLIGKLLKDISAHIEDRHLVISLAAGISIDFIESRVAAGTRVIRAMPNTPSVIGEGATVFSVGSNVRNGDSEIARNLFSRLGICLQGDESIVDAVMAVSGSGPAYAYVAIDALADGGVKMGLPRDTAIKLAAQTLLGSAKMVLHGKKHPSELKDDVCSPGGTTIDAIHELEKGGFRKCLIEAVEAACLKARKLNEQNYYNNKK
ncbi:pyrroline-5-carboxylate reductase 1, mitochondrial-like [Apostichopus japonicus]|uniref:pyrroline-5-carboxylate reductase 1, mitochondrial-like n=1 Tax=Stichopus japonicus TaxID=307972 RepID=UPI003AB2FD7C